MPSRRAEQRLYREIADIGVDCCRNGGAFGFAIGQKLTRGRPVPGVNTALTFFVRRKIRTNRATRRLAGGRQRLPKRIKIAGREFLTDVIADESGTSPPAIGSIPRKEFPSGGPISNTVEFGTFGCLVTRNGQTFAVTNKHVAIAAGNRLFFPSPSLPGHVMGTAREVHDLILDETFLPFQDEPNCFVDVDAALIEIPAAAVARFSSGIKNIGTPTAIFTPDSSSLTAYANSLIGKPVRAWSYASGVRHGSISHVLFRSVTGGGRPVLLYTMVIRGAGDVVPSVERDSGKVWVSTGAAVEVVGLHQASIPNELGTSRYALATDFSRIAEMLGIALAP